MLLPSRMSCVVRPSRKPVARVLPLLERLDQRVLLCAVPHVPQTLGAVVGWAAGPMESDTVVGSVSQDSAETWGVASAKVLTAPVKINFQPAGAPTVSGYVVDGGATYGSRNGYTYGWTTSHADAVVDRNINPNQALDTNVGVKAQARWELAVPNGTYAVKVTVGDAAAASTNNVWVEGTNNIFAYVKVGANQFLTRTTTVTVSDGRLTIGVGGSPTGATRINFIEAAPTSPPPTSPPPTSPPVSNFTSIGYTTGASAPIARAEALKATYGNRLYVFGGFNLANGPVQRSDYYNTATNTWTRIADLPQRLTHVGVAQDDQNAYFIGGYVGTGSGYRQTFGSRNVWVYNFATNRYSSLPQLPAAYSAGGAAVVGRQLHYFAGQDASRRDTRVHLSLNLDNLAAGWQQAPAIPHGRSHLGAVALGGKIYTIAGQIGNDGGLTTQRWVDIYNPATRSWSSGSLAPRAISHITSATFVMGGRILMMGGESAHQAQLRDVYAYNPVSNSWATLSPLPAARFSGVAGAFNGKIVFTGGSSSTVTWIGTPR